MVCGVPLYTDTIFPASPKNTSICVVPDPFVQDKLLKLISTSVAPLTGLGLVADPTGHGAPEVP